MARAYPVADLSSLLRRVALTDQGEFLLQDIFRFSDTTQEVEEVFITWKEVVNSGNSVILRGEQHDVCLTILSPVDACFKVEALEQASRENHKPGVLKRLTIQLPPAQETQVSVRAEILDSLNSIE
jgi:hypothetical protein